MDPRTAPTLPSGLEFVKKKIEGYEYSMYLEIWLITKMLEGAVAETEPTFKFIKSEDQDRLNPMRYRAVGISTNARKGQQEILVVTPGTLHLLEP